MGASGKGPGARVARTAAAVMSAVGLAACSGGRAAGTKVPGVTASTIEVGSLVTESGPLAGDFRGAVDGVRAYFDMVNAEGGVAGRRIVLAHVADDGGSPTADARAARRLVDQDHVFAIVGVATASFAAGRFLAAAGIPTFGQVVSGGWTGPPNLFGAFGSVLDEAAGAPAVAWVAKQVGATRVAVVASSGTPSGSACQADVAELRRAGVTVPVVDEDFPPGGSPNDEVFAMAGAHVQMLVSCLQTSGTLRFDEVMKQYRLANDVTLWLDGYSPTLLAQDAPALQRSVVVVPHVPVQVVPSYAQEYPGMVRYVDTMDQDAPQWTDDEAAFEGWVAAAQFVSGLRAVGRDLTRAGLVAAVNAETGFTAGGLMAPVDWRTAHTTARPPYCAGFIEVYDGQAVPALLGPGGQALRCFDPADANPVAVPRGTPGPTGSAAT